MERNLRMYNEPDKNFLAFLSVVELYPEFIYMAYSGTLLGLIREGNLIAWDHDVDVVMLPDNNNDELLERIRSSMCDKGFTCSELDNGFQFSKMGGRKIDLQCLNEQEISNNLHYVLEWYVFRTSFSNPLINILSLVFAKLDELCKEKLSLFKVIGKRFSLYTKMQYRVPKEYLKLTGRQDYFGHSVIVPYDAKAVLIELYGEDWMIPKRSKYWHFFSKPEMSSEE
jgi:phosphorylcholine metabolism protein LicD